MVNSTVSLTLFLFLTTAMTNINLVNASHLFQTILSAAGPAPELDQNFPFYPLNTPGIPLPGPNFLNAATSLGDEAVQFEGTGTHKRLEVVGAHLHYLYRRALYDANFSLPIDVKGRIVNCQFLPGHLWGDDAAGFNGGPRPAKVLVLGKCPGVEEISHQRNFCGPSSQDLYRILQELGINEMETADWYVTSLVKFQNPDPNGSGLAAAWTKDCAPLLAQELRLVKPDFILCLGSEASKYLLGTPYSVSAMVGRVMDYKFSLHEPGEEEQYHTAKVMTATHPAAVFRTPELADALSSQLSLFHRLVNGGDVGNEERDIDHACIYKGRVLAALVDQMIAEGQRDPLANIIAVDGEWDGEPGEPGSYLRTIQFSNKDKWARTVVLRHQGGSPAFKPGIKFAISQLQRLLQRPEARVGGHFFRADLPWLIAEGLDLRDKYKPDPDSNNRTAGGFDTGLMYHAFNETASLKLEDIATRLTSAPRYDAKLANWRRMYAKMLKKNDEDMDGYGECPGHILLPYGNYDADVTRRIAMRMLGTTGYDGMLGNDWNGQDCWLAYWTAHMASLGFLEMEMTGFAVDKDRADNIAMAFMSKRDQLLTELREALNWPSFNPRSSQQCVAVLFGERYIHKIDPQTKQPIPVLPPGVRSLGLTPIKSTGKRSKAWADLVVRRQDNGQSPATDKETLGILGHRHPTVAKLRDYKFVSQVLINPLRTPDVTDAGDFERDEDGNMTYSRGLMGCISSKGLVHTHLFQTKETGRASSARPPLQNLSSRREDDYRRILGELYVQPVRSILRVPDGWVGLDNDLTGAELAVLAWLCQDANMIDHVRRNNLPEDHPDHYDIHAQQACRTFRLTDVIPTKTGMKDAGVKGLRVAAKNVNFGIPYGRGPAAIARQCAEEGVDVTDEQCQLMIDAYFEAYPGTADFLKECRERSQSPGFLVGPYGRYRRFIKSGDRQVIGEQERQAQNFPIQNGVADAMSLAVYNFIKYREENPWLQYKLVLQIHDAVVLMCPVEQAEYVYNTVVPECMVNRVPFWPRHLDGTLISNITNPYHFGVDREVFVNWGVKLKGEAATNLGLNWLAT
jgi:uracil-DNA glycosylase